MGKKKIDIIKSDSPIVTEILDIEDLHKVGVERK